MNESDGNINERFEKKVASYGSLILQFAGDIAPAAKARILEKAIFPLALLGLVFLSAPTEAYLLLAVFALLTQLDRSRTKKNGKAKIIPDG